MPRRPGHGHGALRETDQYLLQLTRYCAMCRRLVGVLSESAVPPRNQRGCQWLSCIEIFSVCIEVRELRLHLQRLVGVGRLMAASSLPVFVRRGLWTVPSRRESSWARKNRILWQACPAFPLAFTTAIQSGMGGGGVDASGAKVRNVVHEDENWRQVYWP